MDKAIEPLFEKFASEATPVNVVLLLVLLGMGFIFYLRERERRDLVRQIIALGFESVKAGLSMSNAVEAGNREAREEREAIQALLNLGHKLDEALKNSERPRRGSK